LAVRSQHAACPIAIFESASSISSSPGATVLGSVPNSGADPQSGIQAVLERWVEKGSALGEIIATKYKPNGRHDNVVAGTRPICPYPTVARYKGVGNTDEADNYTCVNER